MKPVSLRTPEEIERLAHATGRFMQTIRARAQRVEQIRKMLSTLDTHERIALLCESIGTTEDEFWKVVDAGLQALREGKEAMDAEYGADRKGDAT